MTLEQSADELIEKIDNTVRATLEGIVATDVIRLTDTEAVETVVRVRTGERVA